ncbi:carboxymuconolactone decarboxylase family protein [Fodinibius halophilus]|uniref:Alkyl hydroperoxide reductase AhpD n=1 Tax=Fodinibius halophilus TaxID=1736908 RepID=A0A6M1SZC0_9BACT|nr:carboxymuconolactone decarboxylase family protein [Fodinibius halophilus]NGP87007.1 alkylhydroperoxidase [Fodinibius halophilus]
MFGIADTKDVKDDLVEDLGLDEEYSSSSLDALVDGDSRYIKDLRVNLKKTLQSDHLSEKETALIALAIAVNEKNEPLKKYFRSLSGELEATEEEIGDAVACASLLAANNVLYRFRHFVDKEEYNNQSAGIKMNIMAKPKLEKEFFELISLAVSAANGCELCVQSHEQSLLKLDSNEERIFDAIRLASVITSLDKIVY